MIKRFIAWLKGSHVKKSEAIIASFSAVNKQLQDLNVDISKKQADLLEKRRLLEEESVTLSNVFTKNALVAANISKLLGE